MSRKNESPQKVAMWEMMRSYLKDNDIPISRITDKILPIVKEWQ